MPVYLKTRITAVGPEVADLAEIGVLILFADGSPPELAEISVMHSFEGEPQESAPTVGTPISIGSVESTITAVGGNAWQKVLDIGHVVISFNGANATDRPGELCAKEVDSAALIAVLKEDQTIVIGG